MVDKGPGMWGQNWSKALAFLLFFKFYMLLQTIFFYNKVKVFFFSWNVPIFFYFSLEEKGGFVGV